MNNSYGNFARIYDCIMTDTADYNSVFAKYFNSIKKYGEFSKDKNILLDLGCGSGNLSKRFAEAGFDVIGVDSSEDCLSIALDKAAGYDIRFIKQDIRRLDLYGTVNVTVAAFDVINHLQSLSDISECFKKVYLFTEPGGIFLFDYNTVYKLSKVLANNIFNFDYDEFFCSWENSSRGNKVTMNINVFEKRGETYRRFTEQIVETAFEEAVIIKLLADCGFAVDIVDFDTGEAVSKTTERILFAAHKI
ncbi:MAG: class I SAM-dependent methyltransferase [Ruminococcus sp.]|nr:class I SAM-dependent methyltransferase [Ruminococcus sp.]